MKFNKITIISIITLLVAVGCHRPATNTNGPSKKTATDLPELPYVLEGDYTPDIGVMYKVLIDNDTCFVMIDSMNDETMHGHYYQVEPGSDSCTKREFDQDRHWKDKRREATVYIYQDPDYEKEDDDLYRRPKYKVKVDNDIEYGQALGFWCSKPGTEDESYFEIVIDGLKNSIKRTTQTLTMDIYTPKVKEADSTKHPLILMFHGGGFYVGDKQDSCIRAWCRYMASTGYVAVSANYRLGFLPLKKEIERSGYMALQDAHAAMRFLVDNADKYGIDTSMLFVGGCSAGSITALNLAFMRDKDRPSSTKGNRNLGNIDASGNSSKATFHIKAVANMWGAVNNLDIMKNSHTDIISFHGDADQVVPYDNGFPFSDISTKLGKRMFDKMYGSKQIDQHATELGLRSRLYTFPGEGHSLHHHADGSWNQKNWESIRDKITSFFYYEIAGDTPHIVTDSNDSRHFYISDNKATSTRWKVEGGFILKIDGNDIWVIWRNDKDTHKLSASGKNRRGFGFNATKRRERKNNQSDTTT